jgi:sec-independent protein translocase protein TatA
MYIRPCLATAITACELAAGGGGSDNKSGASAIPSCRDRSSSNDRRFVMFTQIGPLEIVLVLAIALLVLGPKRLPEAGRSVGRGIRNFKAAIGGDDVEPARVEPERVGRTDSSRGI